MLQMREKMPSSLQTDRQTEGSGCTAGTCRIREQAVAYGRLHAAPKPSCTAKTGRVQGKLAATCGRQNTATPSQAECWHTGWRATEAAQMVQHVLC
jgi:hypothetical protein